MEKKDKQDKSGFDVAISLTRNFMRIHGVWPGFSASKNKILNYVFLVPAMIVFFLVNIPQTVQVFLLNGNLNAILNVLMLGDVCISISFVKTVCVGYNWQVLHRLIISMEEDWNQTEDKEELKIMWQKAKFTRKISIILMIISESTVFVFTGHISVGLYYSVANYKNDTKPMYLYGKFPYDIQKSPNFEITWILQLLATHISVGMFASIDSLFATLVIHLCGQLNNLRHSFVTLGQIKNTDDTIFLKKLTKLVIKHEKINEFLNVIESSFNLMFLYHIFCSTIVICLQGYLFIISIGDRNLIQLIFMVYFSLWFTTTTFIYCYVAELLNEENNNLEHAIFYCEWFNLSTKNSQMLMVPLKRLTKPLELTAGKMCVFSLELFTSVMKTAGGYISVLLAMRKKIVEE